MRIVARRPQHLPAQAAQLDFLAGSEHLRETEARALLARGTVAERVLVPAADLVRLRRRDRGMAAVGRLQGRVAAAMVRMQVGVDEQVELAPAQRMAHQRQRLRRMREVAAVDQRGRAAAVEQHVVGR
jgi:hypothetical protein